MRVRLRIERNRPIVEILGTIIRIPIRLDVISVAAGRAAQISKLLTPREKQVFDGVVAGKANKEIAAQLNVSERTVKAHVTSLLRKFKVKARTEIVRLFYQYHLDKAADSQLQAERGS
jgi:DNA-binding NarL/FixJ family response regulator